MTQNCPYEQNTYMANSPTNRRFAELMRMAAAEFDDWVSDFRREVVYAWDRLGVPPGGGKPADAVVREFKTLATYNVARLERVDELTGRNDCVLGHAGVGSACNQFFPTLLKTKDNTSGAFSGRSIYDFFADDACLERFKVIIRNMIDCDPLGAFSRRVDRKSASPTCPPMSARA